MDPNPYDSPKEECDKPETVNTHGLLHAVEHVVLSAIGGMVLGYVVTFCGWLIYHGLCRPLQSSIDMEIPIAGAVCGAIAGCLAGCVLLFRNVKRL